MSKEALLPAVCTAHAASVSSLTRWCTRLQGPSMEQQLAPFGKVGAWMRRMQAETEPHFSAVHQMLQRATKNAIKWKGSMGGRSKL